MEKLSSNILKPYVGKTVAVAVSGGRDSMVLLSLFLNSDVDFFVVNFEHGIRGESSRRDSRFVKGFCDAHGIACRSFAFDTPQIASVTGQTLEQAARSERYRILRKLLSDKECDLVATAHHLDDQAETVFMRIMRGTGVRGLRGIREESDGFIRPLLNHPREEINAFVATFNIPYVEDETNAENDAMRNFLRNEVFPLISTRYPKYRESLSRLSRNATETEDYLDTLSNVEFDKAQNVATLREPYSPQPIFKREVLLAAASLGVFADIEEVHQNALCDFQNAETAKTLTLAHGIVAVKEPHSILFTKQRENEDEQNEERWLLVPYFDEPLKDGELILDLDKLPKDLVFRHRKNGDVFTKFGGGTKSLGDFLTDRKIPARLRENLTVGAVDNEIYFVAGVEISDKIKIENTTRNKLKITKETL